MALDSSSSSSSSSNKPAMLTIGLRSFQYGTGIIEMSDSTPLYERGNYSVLRERLEADGFILVRNVIPLTTIMNCRRRIIDHVSSKGAIKKGTEPMSAFMTENKEARKGWTVDAESGGVVGDRDPESDSHVGWAAVGNSDEVAAVYNGDALTSFYQHLFGAKLVSEGGSIKPLPNCTWLRLKGAAEMTIPHCDYFYFRGHTSIFADNRHASLVKEDEKGDSVTKTVCKVCSDPRDEDKTLLCDLCSEGYHMGCLRPTLKVVPDGEWHCPTCANSPFDVYTCWIALGTVNYEDGTLCMYPGSHRLCGYERPIQNELPRDYEKVEKQVVWHTTAMGPGDVILFNIKTVHAATKNTSAKFRISCDTRVCASRFLPGKADVQRPGIRLIEEDKEDKEDKEGKEGKEDKEECAIGPSSMGTMSMKRARENEGKEECAMTSISPERKKTRVEKDGVAKETPTLLSVAIAKR